MLMRDNARLLEDAALKKRIVNSAIFKHLIISILKYHLQDYSRQLKKSQEERTETVQLKVFIVNCYYVVKLL